MIRQNRAGGQKQSKGFGSYQRPLALEELELRRVRIFAPHPDRDAGSKRHSSNASTGLKDVIQSGAARPAINSGQAADIDGRTDFGIIPSSSRPLLPHRRKLIRH